MREIRLPLLNCLVIDFPTGNRTLCSPSTGVCYTCPLVSSYLGDNSEQGQRVCYTLWAFLLLIGAIGVVTNCLNVIVLLWKSPCGPSLTSLLIPLSCFDLIACGFALSYSTLSLAILENVSRSWWTMMMYHVSLVTYLVGRTGSLYIAILITVERYLVVAHPFRMKIWWSTRKTRIIAVSTSALVIITNMPRYFSVHLEENLDAGDIPQLQGFPYLFHSSWLGIVVFKRNVWVARLHFIVDFVMPLPTLLVLNSMLFYKISETNSQRRLLTPNQRNEVKAARMFSIVVIVLLLCHILPISFYTYLTFFRKIYRELSFGTTLSVSVNAASNFLIFFACGEQFRQRSVEVITEIFGKVKTCCAKSSTMPSAAFMRSRSKYSQSETCEVGHI